ncbi:hypothetical protein TNCV_2845031 [Trichonephila clavipes]|nr:hypothetical protein TNCV_2845031 [Trichonephila clavipes]
MGALIERLPYGNDCNDDYDAAVSSGTQELHCYKVTSPLRCSPTFSLNASCHTTWYWMIKHSYGHLRYFLPNILQLSGQVISIPWQMQSPSYHIPDMLRLKRDLVNWLAQEVFDKLYDGS